MMDESRLRVTFAISNFTGDPDRITEVLKWKPEHTQVKGQPIHSGIKAKFNNWSVTVPSKSFDVEKQLNVLIRRLKHFDRLKKQIGRFDVGVAAVLEIVGNDTRPALVVPPKQVAYLSKIGASFWVDYYFFPGDFDDEPADG